MTPRTPEIDTREILGETFANARFDKVHFDSNFTDSTLLSVVFDRCRLERVLMARTSWTNCDFRGSTLVVNFDDAVFNQCTFNAVKFKGLTGEYGGIRARFVNCDFSGAQFNELCLRACRFVGCCFEGARFTKCDLRGALHNGEQMENTG